MVSSSLTESVVVSKLVFRTIILIQYEAIPESELVTLVTMEGSIVTISPLTLSVKGVVMTNK